MSAINEAYRVLGDPGRRAMYDRSLRSPRSEPTATAVDDDAVATWTAADLEQHHSRLSPAGPAKLPWKMMLIAAVLGSTVILVASAFNDPPSEEPPDGILRVGSCVAIEPNNLAREVACTNTDDDIVVQLVLPTDGTCPFPLLPHIDRLGLGLACVEYD